MRELLQRSQRILSWPQQCPCDPTPWITQLTSHQYPLFPAVIAIFQDYGGQSLVFAEHQGMQLNADLEGYFDEPYDAVIIRIDLTDAQVLDEMEIWTTHPYVAIQGLAIAPIGIIHHPRRQQSTLFMLSNGIIMLGSWLLYTAHEPIIPILRELGPSLEAAIETIYYQRLLIVEHTTK